MIFIMSFQILSRFESQRIDTALQLLYTFNKLIINYPETSANYPFLKDYLLISFDLEIFLRVLLPFVFSSYRYTLNLLHIVKEST